MRKNVVSDCGDLAITKPPVSWYIREEYEITKYIGLRLNLYTSLLSEYLESGVKILDLGCYTARLLDFLPEDVDYWGVDFDDMALEVARKRGARTIKADLEYGDIPLEEKFDIIVAGEILEHLKSPDRLMLEMKRLLKKDGAVIISLPNEYTIYHRFKVILGKSIDSSGFLPYYHLHFPTIQQNEEFVRRYFTILEKRYFISVKTGGKLEKVLSKISDRIWTALAGLRPTLFARGVVFLCGLREEEKQSRGI